MFTLIFILGFFVACWIASGFTYKKSQTKTLVITEKATFED